MSADLFQELYLALAIGSMLSLLFTERFQLLPAGLVVPGYLALLVERPLALLVVLVISLTTYSLVKYVIGSWTILYGRRKFVAMLLLGILLTLSFDAFSMQAAMLQGVGIIVPGLIANTMERQGVFVTIAITALLTVCTYVLLQSVEFFII